MYKKLLLLSASILMLLAYVNVASACSWMGYQPEVPEALK